MAKNKKEKTPSIPDHSIQKLGLKRTNQPVEGAALSNSRPFHSEIRIETG